MSEIVARPLCLRNKTVECTAPLRQCFSTNGDFMKNFRKFVYLLILIQRLLTGYVIFIFTGKTPAASYQSMVSLFCLTQGRSSDLLSKAISFFSTFDNIRLTVDPQPKFFMSEQTDMIVNKLNRDGYYIFNQKLSSEICDKLLLFATTQKSQPRSSDECEVQRNPVLYDRLAPSAVRYDFDPSDLLNNEDVQSIIADISLFAIAQKYLAATPYLDVLSMWWHTDYSDHPDRGAGQFFHFDLDRPKWLKVFIYLTDVTENTGPHEFVKGSHATGAINSAILNKGYVRITDEEVLKYFPEESIVKMIGARGTVIIEDTRGLHKGAHVIKGDRLIFQFQLSNSLFGGDYVKHKLNGVKDPNLATAINEYRKLYKSFL
jgi:hypothetical protein